MVLGQLLFTTTRLGFFKLVLHLAHLGEQLYQAHGFQEALDYPRLLSYE
jgi:hypothetical protein